jgi:hypothetical protein
MTAAPTYHCLFRATLAPKHNPMRAVRHLLGRSEASMPARLEIGRFKGDKDFLLLAFDSKGQELSDSFHGTMEAAMAAALSEVGIELEEWVKVKD